MTNRPTSRSKTVVEPYTDREFTVTEDDVRGSVVANPEACAAARACTRLEGIVAAWVFRTRTLLLREDGVVERYKNPASLTRTIEGYDSTAGYFPPGTYNLRPINPGSRVEKRKVLNAANPNRENRGIRPHRQPKTRPGVILR